MQLRSRILDWISPEACQAIRDPVWKHIHIPRFFIPLVETGAFRKLQGIHQLGPTSLVYPGATHTRYNHSLGVYNVARRFVERLVSQFESIPECSEEGVKSFLAAALLHDLGHFPYTHSLKELPLRDHESLTADIVRGEEIAIPLRNAGIDPEQVALIVDKDLYNDSVEISLYRKILSGVLDPDKLDYLNRDAYFCGVPYGIQDLDYVLAQILVHKDETGYRLAVRESGVSAIEHILFAKYLMYKAVYWHRGVRTATAMIKRALWHSLNEGIIAPESLYHIDDQGLVDLARSTAHPYLQAVDHVHRGQLKTCILETPFDSTIALHRALTSLEERHHAENDIARIAGLNPHSPNGLCPVLIDVPEAVSFEVDMPVVSSGLSTAYLQTSTVFTGPVVRNFTENLRAVRVFVDPGSVERARSATGRIAGYFASDSKET